MAQVERVRGRLLKLKLGWDYSSGSAGEQAGSRGAFLWGCGGRCSWINGFSTARRPAGHAPSLARTWRPPGIFTKHGKKAWNARLVRQAARPFSHFSVAERQSTWGSLSRRLLLFVQRFFLRLPPSPLAGPPFPPSAAAVIVHDGAPFQAAPSPAVRAGGLATGLPAVPPNIGRRKKSTKTSLLDWNAVTCSL